MYSNLTTNDNATIPFFDETQQNSINPNDDRKSQRTINFSCGSEREKQDNESTITVNRTICSCFFFLKMISLSFIKLNLKLNMPRLLKF
jgi:hypothetical protein